MNDMSAVAIKTELDEIKSEVRSLKGLVVHLGKLLEGGRPAVKTPTRDELDMSDPTPLQEMLL
jgi:hypothetical protein